MELSYFVQGFIKFAVVVFFALAILALLWFGAMNVLQRLFNAARLTQTYYDYLRYLAESEKVLKFTPVNEAELMPVPFADIGKRRLQHFLDNGFKATGVVLSRHGEVCQIDNKGHVSGYTFQVIK